MLCDRARTLTVFLAVVALGCLSTAAKSAAVGAGGIYNVLNFGAKGDGLSPDTTAINTAIDAASDAGGGTVDFPAGNYLSGSIHLKSNITLMLDAGATLEAGTGTDGTVYDQPEDNPAAGAYQDFGHTHFQNSLIWGDGLSNVSIVGPGRIWGRGLVRGDDHPDGTANKSICLKLCRNVILRDFTIQHGGWFGILATGDSNMTIDGLTIDTNRDGMDIDSCRNVHILNCTVNSPNDDGICLKSSYGLGYARATENVTITNCTVSGFDEGSVLDGTYKHESMSDGELLHPTGRIKFGTESNGGFINITVSNCVFENCCGLALESVDGGRLEDVSISNITMRDIVNAPIFLRLGARLRAPAGTAVGEFSRVNISNIVVYNASRRNACILSGVPGHPITDVNLSNIQIWSRGGGSAVDAAATPPEQTDQYPDPSSFGTTPAYGMYVRHVDGITLDNVQLHTLTSDARPAYVFDDVRDVQSYDSDSVPVPAAH